MSSRTYQVQFDLNHEKAKRIARIFYDQFSSRSGFFRKYEMPEYIPPADLPRDSREYALYLTYVISIDFQTDAIRLWNRARDLYENEPLTFDPETMINASQDSLKHFARQLGARYPNGAVSGWKKISRILRDQYEGDPRNITPEPTTLADVRSRLSEFPYLRGRKLSNFYIRAMGENGLFKISDFDELSVAVDIQVARITAYTGVIKSRLKFYGCIHNEPLRPLIEEAWSQAAKSNGVPAWYLDEPLWTVGSKLCSKRRCESCPISDLCERNFQVRFRGSSIEM